MPKGPPRHPRGKPVRHGRSDVGADGLYPVAAPLFCDGDARRHVAAREDTFWFFHEERPAGARGRPPALTRSL